MDYDVIIIGGGPAGLSAALILGRARKKALLCDSGTPRNAAAHAIHGFVTQDGVPPAEFRKIAKEQLKPYPTISVQNQLIEEITPSEGGFQIRGEQGSFTARRVLLTMGMIDVLPELSGYRELWGESLFQCPYCHGYEVKDQAWGCWPASAQWLEFGLFLKGWTKDVMVFTNGEYEVPAEIKEKFAHAGIALEERKILGLRSKEGKLAAVQVEGGEVRRDVLFVRPPQKQTSLVLQLGVALDEQGYVKVNEMKQTSIPGVYAAGDLTTMMQGALLAAAAGATAAYAMNHELTIKGS